MRLLAQLLLVAPMAACAAPLVQDAGELGPDLLESNLGATAVEIRTEDGIVLRGAFVDAGEGAPVVLHLLPSAASTSTGVPAGIGRVGLAGTFETLRSLGWSSLSLDYRGIGRSDGQRDATALGTDGRAMWAEAVGRAGGEPRRVVLRASSLGTLIAADLLSTKEPAAAVLVTPIRSATVVRNAARARGGALGALWAGIVHGRPDLPDLPEVVATSEAPLLLILATDDHYLPPSEAARLEESATAAGHDALTLDGDHASVLLRAFGLEIDDASFSAARTDELIPAERAFLAGLAISPRP